MFGPTDVYAVRLPLPDGRVPIVLGQVLAGMTPDSPPVDGAVNAPMMPIAWTGTYRVPGGETGLAFTSTIGAATDLEAEGTRRLLVHAVYWLVGLADAISAEGAEVALVGDYEPSAFGFHDDAHWRELRLAPWR